VHRRQGCVMSPFTPIGPTARWRTLYGLLRALEVGDVLTYETMAVALDLDPAKDRAITQLAMRRAARELEEQDKHAVEPITNVGYRIVEPETHVVLAKRHQRKAGRSLERGHSKVVNVNLNDVSPELRHIIEVGALAMAAQMDFNRRMDLRQSNLEQAVQAVHTKTERTDEELSDLRERLARLEQRRTSGSE
jgi:hypothetical protein